MKGRKIEESHILWSHFFFAAWSGVPALEGVMAKADGLETMGCNITSESLRSVEVKG